KGRREQRCRRDRRGRALIAEFPRRPCSAVLARRLCSAPRGIAVARDEQGELERDQQERDEIRAPDVEAVASHREEFAEAAPAHRVALPIAPTQLERCSRSSMIARTRISAAPIEYIQNENTMSSMPASMVAAMAGLLVRLTDAPWCKVFHHCTEK